MFALFSLVEVISGVAISLGVGASTFAILFFFMAMRDPSRFQTGKPYQQMVYRILRIAMVLILLTEFGKLFFYVYGGSSWAEVLASDYLQFTWTLIAVLYANAVLMTLHVMPMKFGPAIQATSWYSLGVLTALPIVPFGYLSLFLTYAGGILLAAVLIEVVRQRLSTPVRATQPTGEHEKSPGAEAHPAAEDDKGENKLKEQ